MNAVTNLSVNKKELVFPIIKGHTITKKTDNQGNSQYYNKYENEIPIQEEEPAVIASLLLENFNIYVDFLLCKAAIDDNLLPIANNFVVVLKNVKQRFGELFEVIHRDIGDINIKRTNYDRCGMEDDVCVEAFMKNLEH